MCRNIFELVLFFSLFIFGSVFAQKTYIPDNQFEQALIDLGIDSDGVVNDSVATSDISNIISLDVSNKYIEDLKGIEDFMSMKELFCQNNYLLYLDLKKNINLKILNFSNSNGWDIEPLPIDLSKNINLEYLNCSGNKLWSLNVGHIPNLKTLICSYNKIVSLNVSQNAMLEYLDCSSQYFYGEMLSNLSLGKKLNLQTLICSFNEITNLDLTDAPNLLNLNCIDNLIMNLDLSENTYLETLNCQYNQISNLTLNQANSLKILKCNNNNLTSLNLDKYIALTELNCNNNLLTILNVKSNYNSILSVFDSRNNSLLSCIQVDNETDANNGTAPYNTWKKDAIALFSEDCDNITRIPDVNFEQALINLGIDSDGIINQSVATSDISNVTILNQISDLGISDLTGIEDFKSLTVLNCSMNKINILDISQNTNLTNLDVSSNQLTNLDISLNMKLTELVCEGNQLKTLITSGANELRSLYCGINQLSNINISQNIKLELLECYENVLIGLDVNNCHLLKRFLCGGNQLTSIDLSHNSNLQTFGCEDNQLTSLDAKNGNNSILNIYAINNPLLTCIQVDDEKTANSGEAPYDSWSIDTTVSYSEDCENYLGLNDEILINTINLYPNPVTGYFVIESKLHIIKVEIYSVLGQKLKEVNSDFDFLTTADLLRGIYMIRIYSEKGIAIKKLIKI